MLKLDPSLMPLLKEGDLVDVTLIEHGNKAVFFDVPKIGTGTIYGLELINAKSILKKLEIGDTVTAKVVMPENEDGFIELSLAEADKQKAWQGIKELKERNDPFTITITSANAGGLIADISGVQAFLPASQLSNEHYPKGADRGRSKILEELEKFVGTEMTVKIISVNPRINKLILSEREVAAENVKELLEKYSVGDAVNGIISGVANFGAFIKFADHPEIEGLIHISELSHNVIDHPKEVVQAGDMIKAQITEIREGRVSLSLKALQPNPWDTVSERYSENTIVSGVIYKLNPFGAFVKLDENITGLIHVSEFGSVEELKERLEPGETYKFRIESINREEKRIILKLSDTRGKVVKTKEKSTQQIHAEDTKANGDTEKGETPKKE